MSNLNEIENIELRSEEVQEILGHIPSRIIRYGIVTVFLVILVVFVGSFFFKYPDIIVAPCVLVTENPSAQITPKTSGTIDVLFVSDSQRVVSGHILAVIQNSANKAHVQYLNNQLLFIRQNMFSKEFSVSFADTLQLGDIQPDLSAFIKATDDYRQFIDLNYHQKKINSLIKKSNELKQFIYLMEEQSQLKQQTHRLALSQFQRDSLLFVKNVISLADFEKSKKMVIQDHMALQSARSAVITNRMQLQDIEQQIVENELDAQKQSNNLQQNINQQYQKLESKLAWWFDMYVLTAPISGRVSFSEVWNENQYVSAGRQVFTIIPENQKNIIGRVKLSSHGAGKVKNGQLVNLKFEGYPYQEFGMVQASVNTISLVPLNETYILELNLNDTLITNYGKVLIFKQNMAASAEIITDDLPLIIRLFNPLKSILKEHF